jgi:Fe-S cluster assembly protein SufD
MSKSFYAALETPSQAIHAWKYTPWKKLHPTGKLKEVPDDFLEAEVAISMMDGSELPSGLSLIKDLSNSKSSLQHDDKAVAFLLAACDGDTWKLNIEENTIITSPVFVSIRASGHLSISHIQVQVGNHSDVEIIWSVSGEAGWFGLLREGIIGHGCHYHEGMEQSLSSCSTILRAESWQFGRDSTTTSSLLSLGGELVRSDLRGSLGKGATYKQFIASNSKGSRKDNHHLQLTHPVGNNQSELVIHNSCDDKSRAISTGRLTISKGADGRDASQIFKNLLLSEKARADSIPELEVLADDVSAAHGAASAPLDANQMFYLMSRGLDAEESEGLIVNGFLIAAFDNSPRDSISDWLKGRLTIHLDCNLLE